MNEEKNKLVVNEANRNKKFKKIILFLENSKLKTRDLTNALITSCTPTKIADENYPIGMIYYFLNEFFLRNARRNLCEELIGTHSFSLKFPVVCKNRKST